MNHDIGTYSTILHWQTDMDEADLYELQGHQYALIVRRLSEHYSGTLTDIGVGETFLTMGTPLPETGWELVAFRSSTDTYFGIGCPLGGEAAEQGRDPQEGYEVVAYALLPTLPKILQTERTAHHAIHKQTQTERRR